MRLGPAPAYAVIAEWHESLPLSRDVRARHRHRGDLYAGRDGALWLTLQVEP